MTTTEARFAPANSVRPPIPWQCSHREPASTDWIGSEERSLWMAGVPAGREFVPFDAVVQYVYELAARIEKKTAVIELEERHMTKPIQAMQIAQLVRTTERRGIPAAYQPEAFSMDEDLAELEQLREEKGRDYGRAIRRGCKIPLAE